ncbi:MAG: GatB/YqeY domain-containing protein [Candidatus Omnitrophica bacterium]|nr:GatB/YqeY domain-containing protein [Candidatus Omnitrophota bacterium]
MMLEEKIKTDYVTALKAKETLKSSALSFLRSQLKYVMIEKRVEKLEDPDVITVIKKQIKQRQESIEQFKQGGRQDLADKEQGELQVLKSYLPEELSVERVQALVAEAIRETGAVTMKDMGALMKIIAAKTGGRADNKMISELVKQSLSGGKV